MLRRVVSKIVLSVPNVSIPIPSPQPSPIINCLTQSPQPDKSQKPIIINCSRPVIFTSYSSQTK